MTHTGLTATRNKAFMAAIWLTLILIVSCGKIEPTATPLSPTATPLPPTITPVEATDSTVPPAETRALPTATSMPSTDTPATLPPTATPLPPTQLPALETTATPPPSLTGSGGGTIAFVSDRDGDMAIYAMNADGSQARRVAGPNPGGFCCCPAWSPDGERIAYPIILSERNEHGAVEIWVTSMDGSEHVRVSEMITDELQAFPWPYPTWSPDGTQIAFYAMRAGDTTSTIYIVQANGSGVKQSIPLPCIVEHASWSPAGDRLLLLGGGSSGGTNTYVLSVEEGEVTEVYSGARAADWSPDGTEILVAPEQADELYIFGLDGASRAIGLPEEMHPASIDWSPNGTYIAIGTFPRHRQKIVALYVIAVETGELVTLIEDMGDIYSPNWSPDGNRLLFTSTDDSRRGQWPYATLWSYDTTSDELQQLTSGEMHDGLGVWSPQTASAGLIAFASNQDGDWDIYTINVEDGSVQPLTRNDVDDLSPSWSPDGGQIAFVSNRDGNDEIYIMNVAGSDQRRLTETDASESFPTWSPDGTEISFDSDRDGNWEIYVMASDGSNVRRLTNEPADDWITSWSPDGSQIVFESKRDGDYEIYGMDADGSNQRRLTDSRAHDSFPAWSPDGTQIALMSQRDGNYEIYVMNADGTNPRRVTDNRAEDSDPAWSPDGEWLTFVSHRNGNDEIYIMRTDGSSIRQLTDNGAQNWTPAWQPFEAMNGSINTWVRTFEGPDYGAFFDIVLTEDGNVLAVGATNHLHVPPYSGDALLMKLTPDGDVLWERTWGGDGYEQAWSVALAEEGGGYIFGETDSYGAGGRDFFLLKITENGREDWFKTYGGAGREWPYGMLPLSNGDLLIYGFTEPGTGDDRDQYALRVGPDGEVIWEYTVASSSEELVIDALETADGDLVLAVIVEEDGGLVRLDADGNVLWTQRYELAGWQYASQIAQTDDGGFLLAGFSMSSGSRRQADTWLARCTPTGELEWETTFGDAVHDDYATSLLRLKDGTYLIGGIGNGMLLSRVDQDGNVLWQRSLVGQTVYGADGLIELEDGGYLVAGFIQITNGRSYDAILLRTDTEGQVEE
jgi:Tol biopolymer transport system component